MAKSNLIKLAKGGKTTKNKPTSTKPVVKVVVEKALTPEEERDLKAKEKVKELLSDVTLVPQSTDEVLEIEESKKEPEGLEWLTEEVAKLTAENEQLKSDYSKLLDENRRLKNGNPAIVANETEPIDENLVKGKLVQLFNELQANYMRNPGVSQFGTPNFIIYPLAFMERMVMFFPFLGKEKRYKS